MLSKTDTDKCVACSTCVVQCPVAEVTTKFLGPRMLGPASERFRLLNDGEDSSLTYCANCKNCDISCPQGVGVSNINMLARAAYAKKHRPSFRDWILAHGELESRLAGIFPAALANFGMANPISKCILDKIGISKKADLPRFASKQLAAAFKAYKQPEQLSKKVVLFPGCFIKAYAPQTGMDFVWLLNKAGYRVELPDAFCCCGTPLYTNGFADDARKNAEKNLAEMRKWKEQGIKVLALCPSCELMFKEELPVFFPDLAHDGASYLENGEEFVLGCISRGELVIDAPGNAMKDKKIIYHAPCHLRALGSGMPGLDMLGSIPGLKVSSASAGCCGISGSYGFKKEKYDISMAIGSKLFQSIKNSNADLAATECGTCKVQIMHGTAMPCEHPVSILKHYLEKEQQ